MSKIMERKVSDFRVTEELLKDQDCKKVILKIAKESFTDVTGYLFYYLHGDRRRRLIRVRAFNTEEGDIVIKSDEESIEGVIEYYKKLNSHAEFVKDLRGYDGDDFLRNKISAKLTFKFNA